MEIPKYHLTKGLPITSATSDKENKNAPLITNITGYQLDKTNRTRRRELRIVRKARAVAKEKKEEKEKQYYNSLSTYQYLK